MTTLEALNTLETLARKVTGKDVCLSMDTNLQQDGILDSVDALVFFMELSNEGLDIPETADLVKDGYYRVPCLVELLMKKN